MSDTAIAKIPRHSPVELRQIGNLTARAAASNVEAFFQANKGALEPLVQGMMSPDRLLKIAQTAIKQSPKLSECTVKSLFGSIVLCAMMGLEPNTHEQHCFLIPRAKSIPRKDQQGRILKDDNGRWITDRVYEVNVQMGYRGRIKLAYNSPKLRDLSTHVIHENDKYEIVEGSNPRIEHRPLTNGDRGRPIIYYARARLESGAVIFEWMSVPEIERIRNLYSDAYKNATADEKKVDTKTPWIAHFDAMARKTVLNKFSAYLPTNRQSALAEAIDRRDMSGSFMDMGSVIDGDADAPFIDTPDEDGDEDRDRGIDPAQLTQNYQPAPTLDSPRQPDRVERKPQEPTPIRRAETRQSEEAPWWAGLGLKGRALTAVEGAPVHSLEEARAHNWKIEPGVGQHTVEQIMTALGVIQKPEQRTTQEAMPLPVVSPKTAAISTVDDDDEEGGFVFGDPE